MVLDPLPVLRQIKFLESPYVVYPCFLLSISLSIDHELEGGLCFSLKGDQAHYFKQSRAVYNFPPPELDIRAI